MERTQFIGIHRNTLSIDAPGLDDAQDWSHANPMRFDPVGTPQFGRLHGRRTTSGG